jgi:hypothetical protein
LVELVREISSVVRSIAEEVSVEILKLGTFYAQPFPKGWCQDTSRVLGNLLQGLGEVGFKLVTGERPANSGRTHVWLERDGVIVDITADQFTGEISERVMVTTDRSWHDTWYLRPKEDLEEVSGNLEYALYEAVVCHPTWHTCFASLSKP